jgi:hypothetical protein
VYRDAVRESILCQAAFEAQRGEQAAVLLPQLRGEQASALLRVLEVSGAEAGGEGRAPSPSPRLGPGASPRPLSRFSSFKDRSGSSSKSTVLPLVLWPSEALCNSLEERVLYHCGLKALPGEDQLPAAAVDTSTAEGLTAQLWLMFTYLGRCLQGLTPQLLPLEGVLADLGVGAVGTIQWGFARSVSRLARQMLEGYFMPSILALEPAQRDAVLVTLTCMVLDLERKCFWCGHAPQMPPHMPHGPEWHTVSLSAIPALLGGAPLPPYAPAVRVGWLD